MNTLCLRLSSLRTAHNHAPRHFIEKCTQLYLTSVLRRSGFRLLGTSTAHYGNTLAENPRPYPHPTAATAQSAVQEKMLIHAELLLLAVGESS